MVVAPPAAVCLLVFPGILICSSFFLSSGVSDGMLKEVVLQVGTFDPITREAMTASQMVPNIALRNATLQYLEEHPWAWAECC